MIDFFYINISYNEDIKLEDKLNHRVLDGQDQYKIWPTFLFKNNKFVVNIIYWVLGGQVCWKS